MTNRERDERRKLLRNSRALRDAATILVLEIETGVADSDQIADYVHAICCLAWWNL
jgi:hypothetical protein